MAATDEATGDASEVDRKSWPAVCCDSPTVVVPRTRVVLVVALLLPPVPARLSPPLTERISAAVVEVEAVPSCLAAVLLLLLLLPLVVEDEDAPVSRPSCCAA